MSIRRGMARGAAWLVSLRFFMRIVGVLSTVVLARLLVPADFGLVAMATVIMGLIMMLGEMNVEAVLIQRSEIDDSYLDGAFGLKLLMAAVQGIMLAALAVPIADFYGDPRLQPIIYAFALTLFAGGLTNTGIVQFQREMRFQQEFLMRAIPKVVAFVVTVVIAYVTRSYWALVAGTFVNQAGRSAMSYALHPYRPRPSREHWREIFRFSKWMVMNQGLAFIGRRGPDLVLGRLVGSRGVGLFSVSYEIAMLPTTELAAPINRAIFAGYSRMDRASGELRRGYIDVAGMIALAAVPAGVGIAAGSPVLIPLLLGQNWLDAVPLVQMLGVAGALAALMSNSFAVFIALGRPYIMTALLCLRVAVLAVAVIYGAMNAGPWGAALACLVVNTLMLPVQLLTTLHFIEARVRDYLPAVYRPVLAAALMYGILDLLIVPWLLAGTLPQAVDALLVVAVGAVLYTACVLLLWLAAGRPQGAEPRALEILRTLVWRWRSRTS